MLCGAQRHHDPNLNVIAYYTAVLSFDDTTAGVTIYSETDETIIISWHADICSPARNGVRAVLYMYLHSECTQIPQNASNVILHTHPES